MVSAIGGAHNRAMPRLVVIWKLPLGLRAEEAEAWARDLLQDLASLRTRPLVALADRAVPVCAE